MGARVRILGYNIHSSKDDLSALASVVRSAAPDVAILQEAPRRFRWRQKCANLARAFDLIVAAGGLPSLGNLVLTNLRVQVRETWCVQYPLTPGRHMRGAVFAECTVGRVPFTVSGSHLSIDATERAGQAIALKKQMAEVTQPLIFAGDLNENSGGAAWRTVADGLVDAAVACDCHDRPTFSCANPTDRIDVVLVDPRISVVNYDVLDSPAARAASDHFPLIVDLELPE
jgi:endonuclease/exonuclease/phosphatase family metal-dependent hydrolase